MLTSHHVNHLVFLYLQEAGFKHSAFTFAHESSVVHSPLDPASVPPGSLVTLVQKGLQFLELEANVEDGDVDADFAMLTPEELVLLDIEQLRQLVIERRDEDRAGAAKAAMDKSKRDRRRDKGTTAEQKIVQDRSKGAAAAAGTAAVTANTAATVAGTAPAVAPVLPVRTVSVKEEATGNGRVPAVIAVAREEPAQGQAVPMEEDVAAVGAAVATAVGPNATTGPLQPPPLEPVGSLQAPVSASQPAGMTLGATGAGAAAAAGLQSLGSGPPMGVPPQCVTQLQGHTDTVWRCAWHPLESILATGSQDWTARIWQVGSGGSASSAATKCCVLQHQPASTASGEQPADLPGVLAVDWATDGSQLATGACDGSARVWTKDGKLRHTMAHSQSVVVVKWGRKSDQLLTGAADGHVMVWDTKTGEVKQDWDLKSGDVMDVEWRSSTSFAACAGSTAFLCKLGEERPVRTWQGHSADLSTLKWDAGGQWLATASEDHSVRVWSPKSDECQHTLTGHQDQVYGVSWRATGPGTAHPGLPLLLSSCSWDHTVKLWELEKGQCTATLALHTNQVFGVAFSSNGRFLATGATDKLVYVWSVADGRPVRVFQAAGAVHDVCWNPAGDRLAAVCADEKLVYVLDLRL